ncbi:hypothetical protein A2U01_0058720, partial [Trifolium medium]|nr:hypothetical protein [Trifolium medium]
MMVKIWWLQVDGGGRGGRSNSAAVLFVVFCCY